MFSECEAKNYVSKLSVPFLWNFPNYGNFQSVIFRNVVPTGPVSVVVGKFPLLVEFSSNFSTRGRGENDGLKKFNVFGSHGNALLP